MSTTFWFDAEGLLRRVRAGLEQGLEQSAERVAGNARQRAPIRKVFREKRGFRFRTRALAAQEKSIATRLANEYYGREGRPDSEFRRRRAVAHIAYYARVTLPSRKSANTLANSRADRQLGTIKRGRFQGANGARRVWSTSGQGFEPGEAIRAKLTARGLSEVRSGAAVHVGATGKVQIGGRLKASIDARPVRETATGVSAEVVADAPYARYVEFPTIHNRAQPFLLPALKDEQRTLVRSVAASIRSSLGR